MLKKQRLGAIVVASALCAMTAHADEVLLKNGDRITGTVLGKSGSSLEMKTDYADKIVIKWDAVQTFNSEKPVNLILKDKQELTGLAKTGKDGTLTLKSDGIYQTQPIPLTEIAEINKKFFTGQANAGGVLSGGNTERQAYHLDSEVIVSGRDDRVIFGGQYNYADSTNKNTNQTELNARNFQFYANYAHFFTDQWYGYANGLFTNDRLQDVKLRSAFGIGAGYQFFQSEDLNLSLEAGPAYVNVDFYDSPYQCNQITPTPENPTPCKGEPDRTDISGRWMIRYDQWLLSRVVQLFHIDEGLVSSDVFIRTRTGFRVPIWNGIQFSNEVQVDYYSKPARGKETTDTRYLFNIGYGW